VKKGGREGGREVWRYVHGGEGRGHVAGDGGGEDDAAGQLFLRRGREGRREGGREGRKNERYVFALLRR